MAAEPSVNTIEEFKNTFGKKPFLVSIYVDWQKFVPQSVIQAVYSQGCLLVVSWEPWFLPSQKGFDFQEIVSGKWDFYISEFARQVAAINNTLFIRFAHEMNGNWYPWSGSKIGRELYVAMYRHIKDVFLKEGVTNTKWIFSINSEDVPRRGNQFMLYYPGDEYVDFVGIDGYNWGRRSFKQIFSQKYQEALKRTHKPVLITEFSSASYSTDKALWIKHALSEIKKRSQIKGFILFNVDKEADWRFSPGSSGLKELKNQLRDDYFRDYL